MLQINPVWLYGPFDPSTVSSPAQPDWYLGWLEGALRIFPPWEIRAFGHAVPNPFFPAVLLPGVTFLLLYSWPFLERRVTGDRAEHQLLDRPRDRPFRTAFGAAALTFFLTLHFAASNDLIAKVFLVPVNAVTWAFRILVVSLPVVVFALTHSYLSAFRRSGVDSPLHVPADAFLPARLRRRVRAEQAEPAEEIEPPPGHALYSAAGREEIQP